MARITGIDGPFQPSSPISKVTKSGPHEIDESRRHQHAAFRVKCNHLFPIPDRNKISDEDLVYRHLLAHQWDEKKALKSLTEYVEWRTANDINNCASKSYPEEVKLTLHSGGYFKKDKEGHPVFYDCPDPSAVTKLVKAHPRELLLSWHAVVAEHGRMLARGAGVDRITCVLDLRHVGAGILGSPRAMSALKAMSSIDQHKYPENMRVMCIINAPSSFQMIWRTIKGFLEERVQKKIKLLSKLDDLDAVVSLDDVPVEFGGKATGFVKLAPAIEAALRGLDRSPPGSDASSSSSEEEESEEDGEDAAPIESTESRTESKKAVERNLELPVTTEKEAPRAAVAPSSATPPPVCSETEPAVQVEDVADAKGSEAAAPPNLDATVRPEVITESSYSTKPISPPPQAKESESSEATVAAPVPVVVEEDPLVPPRTQSPVAEETKKEEERAVAEKPSESEPVAAPTESVKDEDPPAPAPTAVAEKTEPGDKIPAEEAPPVAPPSFAASAPAAESEQVAAPKPKKKKKHRSAVESPQAAPAAAESSHVASVPEQRATYSPPKRAARRPPSPLPDANLQPRSAAEAWRAVPGVLERPLPLIGHGLRVDGKASAGIRQWDRVVVYVTEDSSTLEIRGFCETLAPLSVDLTTTLVSVTALDFDGSGAYDDVVRRQIRREVDCPNPAMLQVRLAVPGVGVMPLAVAAEDVSERDDLVYWLWASYPQSRPMPVLQDKLKDTFVHSYLAMQESE